MYENVCSVSADGPLRLSSDDLEALRSLQTHFHKCVVSSGLLFLLHFISQVMKSHCILVHLFNCMIC